jgi:predicted MPP superfamily phosphohydrolase
MGIYHDAVILHGSQHKAAIALGLKETTFKDRLRKERKAQSVAQTISTRAEKIPSYTPPPPSDSPFTKILYFTDAHNQPGMSQDRFVWLARLANHERPDIILDGGDGDDFNSLCTHERDETYQGKLKPLLAKDLEHCASARKLFSDTLTHKCRKVITLGNHEARLWTYENNNPAIWGMATGIYTDILTATGWEYHKYGAYVDIAGIKATHVPFNVMGKPVGGETACKQIADKSLRDVVFGHTHKLDVWNSAKFGDSISVTAFNGGCFMPDGYVPAYSQDTRKEFWYGAHIIMVRNGRIKSIKSWHMSELEILYG